MAVAEQSDIYRYDTGRRGYALISRIRAPLDPRMDPTVNKDSYHHPPLAVEVRGPYACFTRPELKSERVSYPVMTPSAARGILEAIYWKPEFDYVVTAIEVLEPIRWASIRRNEVTSMITLDWVRKAMADATVRFDVEADRDQRNTVFLRDVAYRIHAQVRPRPHAGSPEADLPGAVPPPRRPGSVLLPAVPRHPGVLGQLLQGHRPDPDADHRGSRGDAAQHRLRRQAARPTAGSTPGSRTGVLQVPESRAASWPLRLPGRGRGA